MDNSASKFAKLRALPVSSVRIEDEFWASRLRLLQEVILPAQYEMLEETGRIDNFRRAAGKIKQEFKGRYYNDSDVYKWVEAAALSLAHNRDPKVESLMERIIDEIVAAQEPDGYLTTYFTFELANERWSDLGNKHELYCAGHLIQAAIAHYRVTGRRKLLDTALHLADHIDSVFGNGKKRGTPGHPEVEMALVELYRLTNEQSYLKLARFFLDNRGKGLVSGETYRIDHKLFRELEEITGHAVMSLYLNSGATDIYMETGEDGLISALERMWHSMVQKKMYVTGGVGARHEGESFGDDYELPNRRAYAETCAAIANIMWNWRMLLATGEERFAEVIELALYNGALSGISLDDKEYFYVNPLSDRGTHRRQSWFECACCPTNIIRLLASVPHYLYATSAEGIWSHLYLSGTAEIKYAGSTVKIVEWTRYPWEGEVKFSLYPEGERTFSLYLRIPEWCDGAKVFVNGKLASSSIKPGSYFRVQRTWRPGDEVRLLLPMKIQKITSHPWVEGNTGKIAIKRGPLVYCLEQADNPESDVWDIILPDGAKLIAEWDPGLLGGIVAIRGEGRAVDITPWHGKLYTPAGSVPLVSKPIEVTAVPYYSWANRAPGPMAVWIRSRA